MSELAQTVSNTFQPNFNFLKSNKEVVRLIVEIIVFLGICYYFNSKNAKTLKHIEDLSQRLEEQEDENEKMRHKISELTSSVEELKRRPETFKPRQPPLKPVIEKKTVVVVAPPPVEKFTKVFIEEIEEIDDFDKELENELSELFEEKEVGID
jgi:prefoldin subunit 5